MGGSYILAINVALGLAIMCSFLAAGLFDRSQKGAFWWCAACVLGVLSGLVEYSIPPVEFTAVARFLIHTTFALSMCCLSIGLAVRYVGRVSWPPILTGLAVSLACYLSIGDLPRDSLARNVLYQMPYTLIGLIGLRYVLKGMQPDVLDRAVAIAVGFNALHFLLRPPLVILLGGNGLTAQQYLSTDYAMASQTLLAIATIAVTFALGIRTLADILVTIRQRSETDALSGMKSRDGFTRGATRLLGTGGRGTLPMALVICDLDHFKTINDTHGHQAGDRVIAAFGRLLNDCTRAHDLAGRVGGEEFCVLLQNSDGSTARLFAERVRSAFEALDLGLPEEASRPTASFGVSEIGNGDTFEIAYTRADQALYEAKRAGRNRVRQWRQPIALADRRSG